MTARQLKQVAIALVVVTFLWGLAEIFQRGSDELAGDFALPALNAADVDSIRLERPLDSIVLGRRGGEGWSVNGFEAAADAVNGLFEALAKSTVSELTARSAASHARLGVDSALGKRLVFSKGGSVIASLFLGQRGPGFTGVYVRPSGSDEVYLVRGDLANYGDRLLDDWRDRRLATIDPDSVYEVRVEDRRGAYTLRRGDDGWRIGSAAADSGAVRRMLEQWRSVTAAGFATPAQEDSTDFRRPERSARFSDRGGALLAELALDSSSYWWWARRQGSDYTYRLESWRIDQLMPADSSLRAK